MPVGRTSKKVVSDMMPQMITTDQNSVSSSLEQRDNYLSNKNRQLSQRVEKMERILAKTTDDLAEGAINLFFTSERVQKMLDVFSRSLRITPAQVYVDSTGAFYLGIPDVDGTWRIARSGNNLVRQRRELGTYVTKGTDTP